MKKNRKQSIIFKNVTWIIDPKYDWIDRYREGLAPYSDDGKWGFIDREGKIMIEPQFEQVAGFSEGLSAVKIDNKWGFIDHEGIFLITPQFDDPPGYFSEGLVSVARYERDISTFKPHENIISVKSKFGFADKEGIIVIEPKYGFANDFSEGLSSVKIDSKYGYINRHGTIIIDPIFDHALSFNNNKALVCIEQKWGVIEHPFFREEPNDFRSDVNLNIEKKNPINNSKLI